MKSPHLFSGINYRSRQENIPFNLPYMTGKELHYISQAHSNGKLAGDGPFTKCCHDWIEKNTGCSKALLTHSCTAALEICALLLDIRPGDEIIMPSFTFVSTANAFVLRGGVPVFVDIREDTSNIDEKLIEDAITPRTKAIVVVHYAGVACEMDAILDIAQKHSLKVIEDAAQGILSSYKGRSLGSIGALGAYSFHETKNVICGEGGALLVNDPQMILPAEIVREKGTDRSRFFRGEVDKYTWQVKGSSFLPGEVVAAFLAAQLEFAVEITNERLSLWDVYHEQLEQLENIGKINRPVIPEDCQHNAHMYYIKLSSGIDRQHVIDELKLKGIGAVFHYVPLHSSPAGLRYGKISGSLEVTVRASEALIRLPLWVGLSREQQSKVVDSLHEIIR
jgi:dTDP-4-amino-4,6-dideoxygalactose transaminase